MGCSVKSIWLVFLHVSRYMSRDQRTAENIATRSLLGTRHTTCLHHILFSLSANGLVAVGVHVCMCVCVEKEGEEDGGHTLRSFSFLSSFPCLSNQVFSLTIFSLPFFRARSIYCFLRSAVHCTQAGPTVAGPRLFRPDSAA